jgi:hypothetical protein
MITFLRHFIVRLEAEPRSYRGGRNKIPRQSNGLFEALANSKNEAIEDIQPCRSKESLALAVWYGCCGEFDLSFSS